jgi:hypothetical protein
LRGQFDLGIIIFLMAHRKTQREWLEDTEARQRNVVFPDTVNNEARFWRNLGNRPWTMRTKIGLGLLAILFGGFAAAMIRATSVSASLEPTPIRM